MQVVLEIPDQHVVNFTLSEISHYLKLHTALLWFQQEKLSAGAACELAEIDRYTFLQACKRYNIPVVNYDEDEIDADFERLVRSME